MEEMEHEHAFGAILSMHDERDYQAKDYIAMGVRPTSYFPDFHIPVLNQGNVGSCVAHALAILKYCQEHKERKSNVKYSTDFIYHNRLDSDYQGSGMIVRQALSQLHKCGVCKLSELPTNTKYPNESIKKSIKALENEAKPQKVSFYVRCNNTDEICEAIYQHGAAIVVIDVKTSFNSFYMKNREDWVLPIPKDDEKEFGCHCLCAIGYNEDGIIIQNSWGESWGHEGRAVLPWGYPLAESWTVIDEVKNWDIIEVKIGEKEMIVNGEKVSIDVPATILKGRTMLPVRAISTAFDCDCEWIENERKVVIRKEKK